MVSFNLEYDWDGVLLAEWNRLGLPVIGSRGFCALRLAQRLLDPVPAGNCKLQTLRQYYRLPERGAHTALGDVQTVADLLSQVLRPIAEYRGLDTWDKLVEFEAEEWYPSRIAFGKHKGRLFQEARRDAELRRWLDWLAHSPKARSAKMGRWYLRQLEIETEDPHGFIFRQGWESLDFSEEVEITQLRRLYETLQLEIIKAIEASTRLRESPDFELCQISEKRPGVLDELASEKAKMLAKECAELEKEANRFAEEIAELSGQNLSRIS